MLGPGAGRYQSVVTCNSGVDTLVDLKGRWRGHAWKETSTLPDAQAKRSTMRCSQVVAASYAVLPVESQAAPQRFLFSELFRS